MLLRKDVYPYDDMDERVNFSKASLPENEGYGGYYRCRLHACKKVFKDFEIKNLGEYHDFISQK